MWQSVQMHIPKHKRPAESEIVRPAKPVGQQKKCKGITFLIISTQAPPLLTTLFPYATNATPMCIRGK